MIEDKQLRLIAAIVILFIGAAYMTWLVLEYLRSSKLDEFIRETFTREAAAYREEIVKATKVVPGEVQPSDDGG